MRAEAGVTPQGAFGVVAAQAQWLGARLAAPPRMGRELAAGVFMSRLWRSRTGCLVLLCGLLWLGLPSVGRAAGNMDFAGVLIAPPQCTVSDKDAPIRVSFGNVLLRKIDGEHYRQPIPYQIKCPGLVAQNSIWKMRLTFKGSAADFNPALLRTSVSGLAIKLFLGARELELNQPRQISLDSLQKPPAFEAVPVKKVGAQLALSEFNASGLLLVELY
ncbi:hypothetical protein [Pseudomonas fluorescens]|nr:hypothetical protein [Pseudomonas fluorescens]